MTDGIRLGTTAVGADPGGDAGLGVLDKDILHAIGIAGHQVARFGLECNITAIGTDVPDDYWQPFACVPALSVLTRVVTPVWVSLRKMSYTPLVSPATRLVASDWNAT